MTTRPWSAHYPSGLTTELPPLRDTSLTDLFERCSRRFGDLPALENLGTTLSYHDWDRLSLRLAHFLHHRLGLGRGERLAIMLPNLLQYPVALVAALRAGLTVVNINPLFTPRELAYELEDSEPAAILLLESLVPVLEKAQTPAKPAHILTTRMGDLCPVPKRQLVNWRVLLKTGAPGHRLSTLPFLQALREGRETPLGISLDPDELAFIQYTGGTTGTPTGAMLSHGNLLANIEQARLWLTCPGWKRRLESGCEVVVTALPLYHIFALTANLWIGLVLGAHNHLISDPRDLKGMIRTLGRIPFTCITGVNTLFDHLLHTKGFDRLDFSRLKLTLAGGMPMHRKVAESWQALTGCPVVEGYGLTEASPVVTLNPPDLDRFTGSIGLPLPGTDCCIRSDHRCLPPEERGELCVLGPQVMQGYWRRPDETSATFTSDGWLRTGDIARISEDGYFYIVGRKKDMILVSGFNVYPNEIEEVIATHPGVRECAAIGIPDEHTGEAVKVFVVRGDPDLQEQDIEQWCRERLTAYKRPRHIEFRDELPKSAVSKVLRRKLKEK